MSEFIVKSWEVRDVTRKTDISVQIGGAARARYIPYVRFGIWDTSHTPIGVSLSGANLVAYAIRVHAYAKQAHN